MSHSRRLRLEPLEDRRLLSVASLGEAFAVNSPPLGLQRTFGQSRSPSVAVAPGGDFVVTWSSFEQDGSDWGVYARSFSAQGQPTQDEFQVNATSNAAQKLPAVAMDADGDFVVTWSSLWQDNGVYGVYGRRYAASGGSQGDEFQVNTTTAGNQNFSSVAVDPDGDFLIAWTSADQDGDRTGIFAQRYAAAGAAQGGEFQLNTTTAGNQRYPVVAADGTGNFIAIWTSDGQDGSSGGIFGQRLSATGETLGVEFQVNTTTAGNQQLPAVSAGGGGSFVVTWQGFDLQQGGWNVYAQRFDSAGTPLGSEILVGPGRYASVAADTGGDFLVAWQVDDAAGLEPSEILVRHYDGLGQPQGVDYRVSATSDLSAPSVDLQNGHAVVVWTRQTSDPTEMDVVARRFQTTSPDQNNQPPVLDPIADQTIDEGSLLALTATASDPDVPADGLTFSLEAGAPAGTAIDSASGAFTWTPTEAQGPGDYQVTLRVTDTGGLFATQSFGVTVGEVNQPPVLDPIADQTADEGSLLALTATASDPDVPADGLTFSLEAGAPAGTAIDSANGAFTWTPTEAQGPGDYQVTIRVTDTGGLFATQTFGVTVDGPNEPPVLEPIADRVLVRGQTLSLTAVASDPEGHLTFSLDAGAAAGAAIDPLSGQLTWTPPAEQPPGWYPLTVRVADDAEPAQTDWTTFRVRLVNQAPDGAVDWGTVAFEEFPPEPVGEAARFRIRPVRDGRLTIEALFSYAAGDIDLTLVDQAGNTLAVSQTGGDNERVDATVSAGSVYDLVVAGANPAVGFLATNLLAQQGDTATVFGTGDPDVFLVTAGRPHQVAVNGVTYALDADTIAHIDVQGEGPADTLQITETGGDETISLWPQSADVSGSFYRITASGVAQIVVHGGGGTDAIRLDDSASDDLLEGGPGWARMTGEGFSIAVDGFDVIQAISKHGGHDVARLADSPGDDEFIGKPLYSKLAGPGYFLRAKQFDEVYVTAGAGGQDVAHLYDSDYDDTMIATPEYAQLSGPGFFYRADGFEFAHGYARDGGQDVAHLYDSAGDDTFKATPEYGKLFGPGYYLRAKFFEFIHAYATRGGNDLARLYDSPGDDVFKATPRYAKLYGEGFFRRAKFFEEVRGRANAGGNDLARLVDSALGDLLEADSNWARLSNTEANFSEQAIAFDVVIASSAADDDNDTTAIAPTLDFLLQLVGNW